MRTQNQTWKEIKKTLFLELYQMEAGRKSRQTGTCRQESYRIFASLMPTAFVYLISFIVELTIHPSEQEKAAISPSLEIFNVIFTLLEIASLSTALSTFSYSRFSLSSSHFGFPQNNPWKFENYSRKITIASGLTTCASLIFLAISKLSSTQSFNNESIGECTALIFGIAMSLYFSCAAKRTFKFSSIANPFRLCCPKRSEQLDEGTSLLSLDNNPIYSKELLPEKHSVDPLRHRPHPRQQSINCQTKSMMKIEPVFSNI